MAFLEVVSRTEKHGAQSEDRIMVLQLQQRTVILVTDGAGGTGSGGQAADTVAREVKVSYPNVHSADQWVRLLMQLDCQITLGEATAVVVDVRPYGIAGASVGDSQACLINGESVDYLTSGQIRKPLLGSGQAIPVGFTRQSMGGTLLVGSDGFFDYTKTEQLTRLIATTEFFDLAGKCVESIRLPSGDFWDDVSIAVARVKAKPVAKKKYSI